jgi:hypothetical protein
MYIGCVYIEEYPTVEVRSVENQALLPLLSSSLPLRITPFIKMAFPSVRKFDGKNDKNWASNLKMRLSQERCMGIVDRNAKPPPTPTKEELHNDGKPISGLGSARVYSEYTWRYWGARRLIHGSPEESVQYNYMSIQDPVELWDAIKSDYVKKLQKSQYYIRP